MPNGSDKRILRALDAGAAWCGDSLLDEENDCWWSTTHREQWGRGDSRSIPRAERLAFIEEGLIRPEPTRRYPTRCVITEKGRRIARGGME